MSEHTHEFTDGERHGLRRRNHEEIPAHPCDAEGHEHHHHADGSCCCNRHEKEFHGLDPLMAARLAASAALYLAAELPPLGEAARAALLVGALLAAGCDVLAQAVKNVLAGRFFDEYFLMSFAAVAACAIGEFEEGTAVMLLYRVGETAQDYAIRHSRRTLAFMQDAPEPGEKLITRFSRVYTPVILLMALATAALVPLLDAGAGWSEGVHRALTFLVLACPCAIVISVPLGYSAGIGAASRRGVFFRDSAAVDALAKAGTAAEFERVSLGAEYLAWSGTAQSPAVAVKAGTDPALARRIARKTRRIVLENIGFVITVKLAVLALGALGKSPLWFAVFADSGVTVIAVLNSLRAFAVSKKNKSFVNLYKGCGVQEQSPWSRRARREIPLYRSKKSGRVWGTASEERYSIPLPAKAESFISVPSFFLLRGEPAPLGFAASYEGDFWVPHRSRRRRDRIF